LTGLQQQKLDSVTTEISDYLNSVWVIKDLSDTIHKRFGIASPYLNFRDSLFHYKKMYEAALQNNEEGFIMQYACIEEHLNRGLKDFAIHLCSNFFTRILHQIIESNKGFTNNDTLPQIIHIYHSVKNIVLEIRLEGQTLKRFDGQKIAWLPKVCNTAKDLNDLLEKDYLLKRLYDNYTKELFQ
jgi:hypothetical protein